MGCFLQYQGLLLLAAQISAQDSKVQAQMAMNTLDSKDFLVGILQHAQSFWLHLLSSQYQRHRIDGWDVADFRSTEVLTEVASH
jgi:hypoxanthine-guanine phosphoribosyltransferase